MSIDLNPKVSVIVPYIANKGGTMQRMQEMFDLQTYKNKELLMLTNPGTPLGKLRNNLCSVATGSIICHMDFDDLYAPNYIANGVKSIVHDKADVVGFSEAVFWLNKEDSPYMPESPALYIYRLSTPPSFPYMLGSTLMYRKSYWEVNKFLDVQTGEEFSFVAGNTTTPSLSYRNDRSEYIGVVHSSNTCHTIDRVTGTSDYTSLDLCYRYPELLSNRWRKKLPFLNKHS